MIYLVGGAPRAGKSILGQRVACKLSVGWVSTDLLLQLLQVKNEAGAKTEWNAAPEAIVANAEWFFPYLERFISGVSSMAENYVIEGVDFLPAQVMHLHSRYPIRPVFLGCSRMTLESLDQYPGRSEGYAYLPDEMRRKIAWDVPLWSSFIRRECERFAYPYVDTARDFAQRLHEAEAALITDGGP